VKNFSTKNEEEKFSRFLKKKTGEKKNEKVFKLTSRNSSSSF
jgi:hypothetical protein